MNKCICLLTCLFFTVMTHAQNVEVQGQLKVTTINPNNTSNDLLVGGTDGTIQKRDALTLADLQVSPTGDTLRINDNEFWIMPGISAANWAVDGSGNAYRVARIGTQTWIRENLRTTKYNDGTPIPNVTDNASWAAWTAPAYCWYLNDSTTYARPWGALYNQYVADPTLNGNKNVCPVGYHIPSVAEINTLGTFLGTGPGGKLKKTGTANWNAPNTGATDQYLFSAVSVWFRDPNSGGFSNTLGLWGEYWTTTAASFGGLYEKRRLSNNNSTIDVRQADRRQGISLRCLKD